MRHAYTSLEAGNLVDARERAAFAQVHAYTETAPKPKLPLCLNLVDASERAAGSVCVFVCLHM